MFLKDEQHYIDQYNRITVDACRAIERRFSDSPKREPKVPKLDEETLKAREYIHNLLLFFETGKRYKDKAETIRKWMARDRQLDEVLEKATPPALVRCNTCKSVMTPGRPHMQDPEAERVAFFFTCKNGCLPNRLMYEGGSELDLSTEPCVKCGKAIRPSYERHGNRVDTTYACDSCGHSHQSSYEFGQHKEPDDPDFEEDRKRFCLTDEQGQEFLDFEHRQAGLKRLVEQYKSRERYKEVYARVAKLKRLTVPQLKAHVGSVLEGGVYGNLVFGELRAVETASNPSTSLEFTVEDGVTERAYDSRQQLRKMLQKGIEDTNWRLMSDGISYRLGVLSGRLRVYESDDELAKFLLKQKR